MSSSIALRPKVANVAHRTLLGRRAVVFANGIGIVEADAAEPMIRRIVGRRERGRGFDRHIRGHVGRGP